MVDTNTNDTSSGSGATPTDQQKLSLRPIILEQGFDTESGFPGLVTSSDNGKTNVLEYTADGKVYRQRDADRIWPYLQSKIGTADSSGGTTSQTVTWDDVQNKPDVALKSDLTWDNIQDKPTLPQGEHGATGPTGPAGVATKTTSLAANTDLNIIKANGVYYSDAVTLNNGPLSGTNMMGHFWIMTVAFAADSSFGLQRITADNGDEYVRIFAAGSWRSWNQATFFN